MKTFCCSCSLPDGCLWMIFDSNNILSWHFSAVTHSRHGERRLAVVVVGFISSLFSHKGRKTTASHQKRQQEGDISHSACKHLIYSLTCLLCTLIKCYWLSHEWSWINEWRPSAGLDVNKMSWSSGRPRFSSLPVMCLYRNSPLSCFLFYLTFSHPCSVYMRACRWREKRQAVGVHSDIV